jgi:hypothetical protein
LQRPVETMRPAIVFALGCLWSAATSGCARRMTIDPVDVPALAAFSRTHVVTAHERGQREFVVRPDMDPVLSVRVSQPCVAGPEAPARTCSGEVTAPLDRASIVDGRLVVTPPPPMCDDPASFALASVDHAVLVLGGVGGIELSRDDMRSVLSYAQTRHVTIPLREQSFEVTPAQRPVLYIYLSEACPFLSLACQNERIVAALEAVTLANEHLHVCTDVRDVVAPADEIYHVELALKGAPPFRQRLGAGLDVAGPVMFFGPVGYWYPDRWLVFEAGFTYVPETPIFGGFVGLRLRVPASSWLVGSIGGSVGGLTIGPGSSGQPGGERFLAGPRFALEVVMPSRRDVVRVEGQAAYTNLLEHAGRNEAWWHPWGGLGYERLF